jgi:hypothetical protein
VSGIVKFTDLAIGTAACPALSAVPSLTQSLLGESRGTGLSGLALSGSADSRLRATGLSGAAIRERSERPTQAPAVVAQAHAYAAANGADAQATWRDGGMAFAFAGAGVMKQQTTRAFRGLEPWRDPA